MSSATETLPQVASSSRGAFIRARLGSLLAIAPLGVWTIIHIWDNLAAFNGAAAWETAVTKYSSPVSQLVTAIIVLVPLVMHTVWGVGRLLTSRPNVIRYGFYANLKYVIQRLSAVGLLLFIGAHLWLALIHPRLIGDGRHVGPETFADISDHMRNHLPTTLVYILGTLAVSYHLANGAHTFLMSWGLVSSRKALKRLEVAALVYFVVLLAMSWAAIYALWSSAAPHPWQG